MKPDTILSVRDLRAILPVRPDFLMLDRVKIIDENHLAGWRNVTIGDHCFQGHFPGHPILPGVLQVEAMAQLAEIAGGKDRVGFHGLFPFFTWRPRPRLPVPA